MNDFPEQMLFGLSTLKLLSRDGMLRGDTLKDKIATDLDITKEQRKNILTRRGTKTKFNSHFSSSIWICKRLDLCEEKGIDGIGYFSITPKGEELLNSKDPLNKLRELRKSEDKKHKRRRGKINQPKPQQIMPNGLTDQIIVSVPLPHWELTIKKADRFDEMRRLLSL
jgi:hypothetical protein